MTGQQGNNNTQYAIPNLAPLGHPLTNTTHTHSHTRVLPLHKYLLFTEKKWEFMKLGGDLKIRSCTRSGACIVSKNTEENKERHTLTTARLTPHFCWVTRLQVDFPVKNDSINFFLRSHNGSWLLRKCFWRDNVF